jgi:hypothetical protein
MDISSITIKFAQVNVSSFGLGYMVVVRYPFLGILNIECITISACDDNHGTIVHL